MPVDSPRGAGHGAGSRTFPTFAVIASKNRPRMLAALAAQLVPQCRVIVMDNGYDESPAGWLDSRVFVQNCRGDPLHRMWNAGIDIAAARSVGAFNVLVINDDVAVPPDFCARLDAGLRADDRNWIACPDDHRRMTGWAFMLRGESGLRLDERFQWWYGDSDLLRQVHAAGKRVVSVPGCCARHLDPLRSSTDPARLAQARADEAAFAAKWGLDPATLWLAQHPKFGQ